jgi:hypothetical protein
MRKIGYLFPELVQVCVFAKFFAGVGFPRCFQRYLIGNSKLKRYSSLCLHLARAVPLRSVAGCLIWPSDPQYVRRRASALPLDYPLKQQSRS